MTATYEKPVILFESFELSQSVAESCGVPAGGTSLGKPNHADKSTCGWDMGNIILWVAGSGICNSDDYGIYLDEESEVSGYCYNTPTPGMQIFSS